MPREDGWASSFAFRLSFVLQNLDNITKLLDSLHDAALEETVRLEVGIVLLHEHVGSQENGITLACRCILCGRRLRNNVQYPRLGVLMRPPAPLLSFEVRSRTAPPRLHTRTRLITVNFGPTFWRGRKLTLNLTK